jgi:hypothetical protein
MTFRNWRYDEETLNHIIEKSPAALEAFNKTLKSIPQMAGLREPIENAVENMAKLSRDLLAAREYLKDADTENERMRTRMENLERAIIQKSLPGGTHPERPWPDGRPDEPMCATAGIEPINKEPI